MAAIRNGTCPHTNDRTRRTECVVNPLRREGSVEVARRPVNASLINLERPRRAKPPLLRLLAIGRIHRYDGC